MKKEKDIAQINKENNTSVNETTFNKLIERVKELEKQVYRLRVRSGDNPNRQRSAYDLNNR